MNKLNISPELIRAGRQQQAQLEAQEGVISLQNGAATPTAGGGSMDRGQRMAGEMGARALELLSSPEEQMRTENWNARFASTPTGMQFFGAPTMV
jgi:hypothetical protein